MTTTPDPAGERPVPPPHIQPPADPRSPPSPWAAAPAYPGYPPPPWPAFGQPPPLTAPHVVLARPVHGRAIGATITAGLVTLVEIGETLAAWAAADTYAQAARNEVPVETILTVYDLSVTVWLAAAVASYIVTCLWLYRTRTNSQLLSARAHVRSRGWVWAGWLVPIVSWWFPLQVVRDTRRAVRPTVGNALIGWWWAAWVAYIVTTQVGTNLLPFSGSVSESAAHALAPVETASAVLAVAACALWCTLLWRITGEQEQTMFHPSPAPPAQGAGHGA